MASVARAGLRWLRSLLQSTSTEPAASPGLPAALDGATAVALTEACVSEVAGIGGTEPADLLARVWEHERSRHGGNVLERPLGSVDAPGPRGALAAAIGLSMGGVRATSFLAGSDLPRAQDLLVSTAGRHLPMVVHVACRSVSVQTRASGTGHDGVHAVADAGLFQLFATNVQDAVDLCLVARRVAERSLVPGMVVMDGEQTAASVQEVHLPSVELVRQYLGSPDDHIESPTPAQEMLFGRRRRRVPRWFDLDRPTLHGSTQDTSVWALGTAGQRPYFTDVLPGLIDEAISELMVQTGRRIELVGVHQASDADVVLVVMGSAIETARALAVFLRSRRRLKVGVVAIRGLRPFPGGRIVEYLAGRRVVAVLERVDTPQAGDGPLMREVRAALGRALENGRFGPGTHPGYPALTERKLPRMVGVAYGLGGLPLRAADLASLVDQTSVRSRSQIYLGMDFPGETSAYPKRQAMIDTLRRAYPGLAELGLRTSEALDVRPAGAVSIGIHRVPTEVGGELAREVAMLLHEAAGGHLRGRTDSGPHQWATPATDRLTWSAHPLDDPGEDAPLDLVVLTTRRLVEASEVLSGVAQGGALILTTTELAAGGLDPAVRGEIAARDLEVFAVDHDDDGEALLAAVMAVMTRRGALEITDRKLVAARSHCLDGLPDAEARLAVFSDRLGAVRPLPAEHLEPDQAEEPLPTGLLAPLAVRHIRRTDETVDSLPRFWSQIGALYREGDVHELVPDPYLTVGAIPPATSTFRDLSGAREMIPVFDPALCTGCGRCWSECPDGAVAPVALHASALLEAGMAQAREAGQPVDALRPLIGKLASQINKLIRGRDPRPTTAGPVIREAFDWLIERVPLDTDRRARVVDAFEAAHAVVAELPIATPVPFFDRPDIERPGSGELLCLAINPDACKACGACLVACEPQALRVRPQRPDLLSRARRIWQLWERLPDTRGETITRVWHDPDVGPLAALQLSRTCNMALAGGDGAEPGSGAKVVVRTLLAAAEFHLQPALNHLLREVEQLRERLNDAVQALLSSALPDADALAARLSSRSRTPGELRELLSGAEGIDAERLRRLVELNRELGELRWRLAEGPDGLGRARLGLVVAPGESTTWAGAFPHNPFLVPVVIGSGGKTPQLARGLLEAQLREVVGGMHLLRSAREALEHSWAPLPRPAWRDLDDDERRLCPPLVLVGSEATLAGRNLADLSTLLGGSLPVKVVLLASGGLGLDGPGEHRDAKAGEVGLLALAHRRAFVLQASISRPEHFLNGLLDAFRHPGPALVRVHAPSPTAHGFANHAAVAQADLAVRTRAFPLFRFDPADEGVFGLCLDLTGNPAAGRMWALESDGTPITPGDWAATEARFEAHLEPLRSTHPGPMPLAEYLECEERSGRTPTLVRGEERLVVRPTLVSAIDERRRTWRTLQELAGIVTPFTDRVRAEAEAGVAQAHAAELEALRSTHEQALSEARERIETELLAKVQERLMSMAGYDRPGEG